MKLLEGHMSSLSFSTNEVIVSRARELSRKLKKQRDGNYCMHIINKQSHDFSFNCGINEHS